MLKILSIILFGLILVGCSSEKSVVKTDNINYNTIKEPVLDTTYDALNQFIDGSIAEAEGNYANAIIFYKSVLKLEPRPGVYFALAKNYLYLNKLSLALQNAEQAIRLDSNKADYLNLLTDIYLSANQNDSAAITLNKIIRLDSSNINAYYRLARIYESNKPLKAINIYNKITNIIGPDWNVLMHVSELYAGLGNFKEAAYSIQRLLTIDPGNIGLQKLLAEYYQRAKMYDDAMKVINQVIAGTPDDLDAYDRKAQIYLAQNNWTDAAKEYDYILKQPKVPLKMKLRIGASYFEQSFKDSTLLPIAKKFFETIDKDTTNWQAKMYLGAIAVSEKNDSTAIKDFKEATKLASWNVETWVRLGGLYFDNQKYDEAASVMKVAIKSFPEDFRVNLILGLSLAQNNHNKEAEPFLKKAVKLNPKDITALSAYGYTLSQLKQNTEAVKYLKEALALSRKDKNYVNLLGTLGLIYDGEKNWTKCDSVYELALKMDSTNDLINNNYAYSLSERGIKLDSALKMAKIAIKAKPTNASYLDTMGWIYFKMGNFEEAEKYCKKSIKIDNKNSDVYEHLGDIEMKMGKKTEALEAWKKALKLNKNNKELKLKIEKG